MSSPLNLTRVSPVLSSLYSRTGPFLSLADYRTGAFTGQDNEASLNVQHRVERSEAERSELHALLRGGQAGDPQAQETGGYRGAWPKARLLPGIPIPGFYGL